MREGMNGRGLLRPLVRACACVGVLGALGAAWAGGPPLPPGVRGPVTVRVTDGVSDDLLTAGLGKSGLMGATPAYADPAHPTASELRRNAIYTNYRALVDITPGGGMGVFYGPNIDIHGQDTLGEGKIAGTETTAWADDGSGRRNVTLMVQLPVGFDPDHACIVTATSSGSRGIYGAIATAGEWGLKHGCAVAYTDKGSGNGYHDLMSGVVTSREGLPMDAATAGTEALFRVRAPVDRLAAFNAALPNRMAYKHAHSRQNPEKDWGQNTLSAVRFALYVLNQQYAGSRHFTPANTLVIASSVSNGGGAALAAAEQDSEGLIDGVAVSEPNAQPRPTPGVQIRQGSATVPVTGLPLIDYFTLAALYQPCALLSSRTGLSMDPAFWPAAYTTSAQQRCIGLAERGLVTGDTVAAQADSAWDVLLAHGWTPESAFLQQSHFRLATNAIAVTYANALGRFGALDDLCGYSFANTDASGLPIAQSATTQAGLFASGNGIPPTSGVNIVYDGSVGGPRLDFLSTSPSTGRADFGLDGALCLRALATGRDAVSGAPLSGDAAAAAARVKAGVAQVQLGARLHGKPTVIVAGRSDSLLPVNHAARAYFARNQRVEPGSPTRYIEVTNGQHFDAFMSYGPALGYDTRFIPLHVYFNAAMDAVWAHLSTGAPLPVSQVVHTVPRASSGTPLSSVNVPPISAAPAPGVQIVFDGRTLVVPD